MPSILPLAAPGRWYCLGRRVTRLASHLYPIPHPPHYRTPCSSESTIRPPCVRIFSLLPNRPAKFWTWRGISSCRHEDLQTSRRYYSAQGSNNDVFPEGLMDAFVTDLGADESMGIEQISRDEVEQSYRQFLAQLSRSSRKAQRQSRPATVLASIGSSARELYAIAPSATTDLSYTSPRPFNAGGRRRPSPTGAASRNDTTPLSEPVSLYSILARYLEHDTAPRGAESSFDYTKLESGLLRSRGYAPASIEKWGSCLVEPRSNLAAKIFVPGVEMPPLFLLLLYLRRKHIRVSALGVVVRHIDYRVKTESISWNVLKILVIRLLRHARELWPESMPWIASLFVAEATRLHDRERGLRSLSPQLLSDVTHFCNKFLLLISLPAGSHPVLSSMFQEKAQFKVLQYMASNSPAIAVTRLGFRSVASNQLAHAKTAQEREWAELKGPSWPPWKENRTAMDEDKGYEFGASRASKILHRMYEAGYGGRGWEDVAQVYAGWDVDSSPTIQTRTLLPLFASQYENEKHLRSMLWAGRIRTTRTRREAWACFLSHELSNEVAHQEIYLAMFEKIYYPTAERSWKRGFISEPEEESEQPTIDLLPGDMKEVLPDPVSPLHYVYLSEPVPKYQQLFHRMHTAHVRPSARLLAFLLETCPDFNMGLDILRTNQDDSDGGIGRLAAGIHNNDSSIQAVPDYLFAAFIRFLCRFGHFSGPPPERAIFLPPEQHVHQFKVNRHYLLEYAYVLLLHYQPKYRPAWTTYLQKIMLHKAGKLTENTLRYKIVYEVIDRIDQIDLDIDDEIFRLACMVTLHAAQTVNQGSASIEAARQILSTGSPRLRTLFNGLIGAYAETPSPNPTQEQENTIPPHIPGPAELHAYVRALGILRDYEGLYSFSTWLVKHHVEVTARAEARHSGSKLLFRTLVALRTAVDGPSQGLGAPDDIAQLIKAQIESVEEWGGWPTQEYVDMYNMGHLKTAMPGVGGR